MSKKRFLKHFDNPNSIVMIALSYLNSDKNSIIPELMQFLSIDQLKKFLFIYSGQTIKIPTEKEFAYQLECALAIYYLLVKKHRWQKIFDLLDVYNTNQRQKIRKDCETWIKKCDKSDLELIRKMRNYGDL